MVKKYLTPMLIVVGIIGVSTEGLTTAYRSADGTVHVLPVGKNGVQPLVVMQQPGSPRSTIPVPSVSVVPPAVNNKQNRLQAGVGVERRFNNEMAPSENDKMIEHMRMNPDEMVPHNKN